MCGIIGYIGKRNAVPIITEGLTNLEYRGYDSAGIAIIDKKRLFLLKKEGKLKILIGYLRNLSINGHIGIGHTRWATHGEPNELNAHPHFGCNRDFLVVHNGIIENHQRLRIQLEKEGHRFHSQTDTEVIVHLVEKFYRGDFKKAITETVKRLQGTFAIGAVSIHHPDELIGVRRDSPLIVGIGKDENFIASDIPAILAHTRQVIYLNNDELVLLTKDTVKIFDFQGKRIKKKSLFIKWDAACSEKTGYPHFMLKEINEQPKVLSHILANRVKSGRVVFEQLKIKEKELKKIDNIQIVACGTAYHAGLYGKYILESLLHLPINIDTSSEFRYRYPVIKKGKTLLIPVSQSGETADTLASLREAKRRGALILSVCNVVGSSIARESDGVIYIHAGPEIAVASTKAYTAQLATFYLLGLYLGYLNKTISASTVRDLLNKFKKIPHLMEKILNNQEKVKKVAAGYIKKYEYRLAEQLKFLKNDIKVFKNSKKVLMFAKKCAQISHSTYGRRFGDFPFLYLGRNVNYPSALEGALKLKEITYISAEGYPAGEMKHGPIALIDEFPLVVCIAPRSSVYDKMLSNIREIKARKGIVLAIATEGDVEISKKEYSDYLIEIPKVDEFFSPLLVALPLQLLAYFIAAGLGCDVDQPRNLAKSVTVE